MASSDGADDQVLEEIVVTGFRRSLQDSIGLKMVSDQIVEAISAEEIGKLPDVSIAESLARLPGLTAQRLNGRGQVISVRGLSPDFTTALLNGRPQVSTGDNRGVEFDQYPSELLSGAVVYKVPDATLIGQGLAGTVDLRTVRPLEYGRRAIAGNVRYEWNSIDALNSGTDDTGERYSLSYIDQFADDTIGLALGYAHMSTPSQGERFNAWGYPDSGDGNLVIGGSKPYVQSNLLERDGFIGVLEYEPSDSLSVAFDGYYSDFEETQTLRGIELPLFWSAAQLQPGYTADNGLITDGQFNDVKGVMRNDVNTRDAELLALGLNVEYLINDRWSAIVDVSHSEVDRYDTILETYSGTGTAGSGATDSLGFTVSGTGATFDPSINYADPNLIVLTSPQGWGGDVVPGGQVGYRNSPSITDELTMLDIRAGRDMDGAISGIRFGVNVSTREKVYTADEFFLALADGSNEAAIPDGIRTGTTTLGFLGIPGMVSYDPLAALSSGLYRQTRNPNQDVIIKNWDVEEDVNIAYLKAKLDTQWGRFPVTGNFGVQVVDTDQTAGGFATTTDGSGNVIATDNSGGASYTEVLPSVNLNFEVGADKFVKVGVARTLARPRMDEMRGSRTYSFNVSQAGGTTPESGPWSGSGGNPALKPWIANAIDVSYEMYFQNGAGYFALAGFYKDLESYIYNQTTIQDFAGFPTGGVPVGTTLGEVSAPANGSGGSINGFELALSLNGDMFTPVLDGFGVVFSASVNNSNIEPNGPDSGSTALPGLSEEIYNITLFYEKNGFSARVSDRYRSEFLGEVSGFGAGRDLTMVEDESIVDAQISYRWDTGPLAGLTLLLQGNNLTDQEFVTFYNEDSRQIRDYQRYGRNFLFGVAYQFE